MCEEREKKKRNENLRKRLKRDLTDLNLDSASFSIEFNGGKRSMQLNADGWKLKSLWLGPHYTNIIWIIYVNAPYV